MLLDRTREAAERLELTRRVPPLVEVVEGEAVELAHARRAGRLVGERLQHPAGVEVATPLEGAGRLGQSGLQTRASFLTPRRGELARDVRCQLAWLATPLLGHRLRG